MNRRSLHSEASCSGIGLFTQSLCNVRIKPAKAGHGITLARTDVTGALPFAAHIDNLCAEPVHPAFTSLPPRNTNLHASSVTISTVEHILSALAGLGITDAAIELDASEVPIFDGSARSFVDAINVAGIQELDADLKPIVLSEVVTVRSGEGWIAVCPTKDQPTYTYELDYGHGPIAPQVATWSGEIDEYMTDVAPARTFSLEHEAKAMQSLGLFTAFTPKDLLVIGGAGPIDNTWRFDNEPARHKLLDLIGDLSLAGAPIRAHITAHKSGHALNHEMARQLAALPPSQ